MADPLAGYVKLPNNVLADPTLTDRQCRVMLALLSFQWGDPDCFPSIQAIGKRSGAKSDRAVQSTLAELIKKGRVKETPDKTKKVGRRLSVVLPKEN